MNHTFQQDRRHPGYCIECDLPPSTEIHNVLTRCDQCGRVSETTCNDCLSLEAREQAEKEYWDEVNREAYVVSRNNRGES